MGKARVLTVSDSVHAGRSEDRSGPAVAQHLRDAGFSVDRVQISPDGAAEVREALGSMCADFCGLVVTTGGTGFGPRDLTPEATAELLERSAAPLAAAMHASSPKSALSRGVAGTVGACLILNLPGSPTGALECLDAVLDLLPHALALLGGVEPHPRTD